MQEQYLMSSNYNTTNPPINSDRNKDYLELSRIILQDIENSVNK